LPPEVKQRVDDEAHRNRRSKNAEIGLLIEEGLKWREAQKKSVA
jgi:predicted transcriptional regulator